MGNSHENHSLIARLIHRAKHEARYGVPHAWAGWKAATNNRAKRRQLNAWLETLREQPPEVLLGANIDSKAGIRNHLLGIASYSSLNVEMAPPDSLLDTLSYHDLHSTFLDVFLNFAPTGISVVHSHVYPFFVKWCRKHMSSGVRWVHTYHLPYFPDQSGSPLPAWQAEINDTLVNEARHAHTRISVSQWQQSFLQGSYGIPTIYVPNGVDVTVCDLANASRFSERVGAESFVLFVGRNDPVKNPADFVRLASRMPDRQFVMIGEGLNAAALRNEWGVVCPVNLLFFGAATRAQVQDALAACSAVVVTSKREGLPTLVLEAMCQGKPVAVPDDPGCVEAISDGEFGFVYRQGDIDDLVAATEGALSDTSRCARSRARILAEYDWRVVAARLDSIYRGDLEH